jgi:hypothetical protein
MCENTKALTFLALLRVRDDLRSRRAVAAQQPRVHHAKMDRGTIA